LVYKGSGTRLLFDLFIILIQSGQAQSSPRSRSLFTRWALYLIYNLTI